MCSGVRTNAAELNRRVSTGSWEEVYMRTAQCCYQLLPRWVCSHIPASAAARVRAGWATGVLYNPVHWMTTTQNNVDSPSLRVLCSWNNLCFSLNCCGTFFFFFWWIDLQSFMWRSAELKLWGLNAGKISKNAPPCTSCSSQIIHTMKVKLWMSSLNIIKLQNKKKNQLILECREELLVDWWVL